MTRQYIWCVLNMEAYISYVDANNFTSSQIVLFWTNMKDMIDPPPAFLFTSRAFTLTPSVRCVDLGDIMYSAACSSACNDVFQASWTQVEYIVPHCLPKLDNRLLLSSSANIYLITVMQAPEHLNLAPLTELVHLKTDFILIKIV